MRLRGPNIIGVELTVNPSCTILSFVHNPPLSDLSRGKAPNIVRSKNDI